MKSKTARTLKRMVCCTLFLLFLALIFLCLYQKLKHTWMLELYVTLLTVFYHFAMRLIVGETITAVYKKRSFNSDSFGFRIHSFEPKLYRILKVKTWKSKVITAKPEQFDLRKVRPAELLHNMMQAELVHRIIMVLSFVPLLLIIPYGVPTVFISTSIFACCIDLIFVIIQRYNRPRIIKLLEHYVNHTT